MSCGYTEHAGSNASKTIRNRGLRLLLPTPEDTYSGSACGALSAKDGVEAGTKGRKAASLAIQGEE